MGYADDAKAVLYKLREETKKASDGAGASVEAVFDARERELLKDCPPEDLAGLANLKKVFPGSRVIKAGLEKTGDRPCP